MTEVKVNDLPTARHHSGASRATPNGTNGDKWLGHDGWCYRAKSCARLRNRRVPARFSDGSDGTRTRDLRRDRPKESLRFACKCGYPFERVTSTSLFLSGEVAPRR